MLPMQADLIAHLILEDRLAHAATQRRVRQGRRARPGLRVRLGATLVTLGTRLQARGHASPQPVTGC